MFNFTDKNISNGGSSHQSGCIRINQEIILNE